MTTEVETVDLEFLGKLPNSPWRRVGDVFVELRLLPGSRGLTGYSLEVNNARIMLFALEDRDEAWKAYKRLIYALS